MTLVDKKSKKEFELELCRCNDFVLLTKENDLLTKKKLFEVLTLFLLACFMINELVTAGHVTPTSHPPNDLEIKNESKNNFFVQPNKQTLFSLYHP